MKNGIKTGLEKRRRGEETGRPGGTSGAAYAWGRNQCGQLGLGDTLTRAGPTEVTALQVVADRAFAKASFNENLHSLLSMACGIIVPKTILI